MSLSTDLERAHNTVTAILGSEAEPIEVIQRAVEHRQYWRPQRVRVVLLAESHVFTTPEELASEVRLEPWMPSDLPRGFVRLVYALGYGENDLLRDPIYRPRNSGTPQYWKILQYCARTPGLKVDHGAVQRSRNKELRGRVTAKLGVLDALRERGVWLVDASVAALYNPTAAKPAANIREAALQASWDAYTEEVVASAEPQAVVCIGVGVKRALEPRLNRLSIPWICIPQPQARLSEQCHAKLLEIYSTVSTEPGRILELRSEMASSNVGRRACEEG